MSTTTTRAEVSFFNERSRSYLDEYGKETPEGFSFRMRREGVLRVLPDGEGKRVLDIAGGPGVMIAGLRKKGYEVDCVDAAPEMVALAAQEARGDAKVHTHVEDVLALSYKNGTFDALTAMGLVEYLDDQDRAMREMARVLKPGGVAIITFPNRYSLWRFWAATLRTVFYPLRTLHKKLTGKPVYPIRHREYTPEQARAYMRIHGLVPAQTIYYNYKLMPFPLDKFFPRLTVIQSSLCEGRGGVFSRFFATAFIVEGVKRAL